MRNWRCTNTELSIALVIRIRYIRPEIAVAWLRRIADESRCATEDCIRASILRGYWAGIAWRRASG